MTPDELRRTRLIDRRSRILLASLQKDIDSAVANGAEPAEIGRWSIPQMSAIINAAMSVRHNPALFAQVVDGREAAKKHLLWLRASAIADANAEHTVSLREFIATFQQSNSIFREIYYNPQLLEQVVG